METIEQNKKIIRKSHLITNYTSAATDNGRKQTLSSKNVSSGSYYPINDNVCNAEFEGKKTLEDHGINITDSKIRNFCNISPQEVASYYKNLGEWQDILPKTDYTYSPLSIYYTKKINGKIPIIPNMSRRNIWNINSKHDEYQTNHLYSKTKNYSYIGNFYKTISEDSIRDTMQKSPIEDTISVSRQNLYNELSYRRQSRFSFSRSISRFYNRVIIFSELTYEKIVNLFYSASSVTESFSNVINRFTNTMINRTGTSIARLSLLNLLKNILLLTIIALLFYFFIFPLNDIISAEFVKIISLFSNLVLNFYSLTQSSITFIMSLMSYLYDYLCFLIPTCLSPVYNYILFVLFNNVTTIIKSDDVKLHNSKPNNFYSENNNGFVIQQWFQSNKEKLVKIIVEDNEFKSYIDEKFKSFEEKQNNNIEKLSEKFESENSLFREKLSTLENKISLLQFNNTETIKIHINNLKEDIRNKEIQIKNNITIALSKIIESQSNLSVEGIKNKLTSLFDIIHEAHSKIDKLSREFSNHVGNASKHLEYKDLHDEFKLTIEDIVAKRLENWKKSTAVNTFTEEHYADNLEAYIKSIVQKALEVYDADKTGQADYALESSGGIILSTRCTETRTSNAQFYIFGIPFWHASKSPRTVIQPGVHPGECWAFPGSTGYLVIQLSERIIITGFTLEHIPRSLASNGTIDSAPKDFSVWALRWETDSDPKLLGKFQFDANGTSLQYFEAIRLYEPYQIVELKILSNHGKMDYTCLYRFRVHGIPA